VVERPLAHRIICVSLKHHTKSKGDLAAIKAIADLSEKGFEILTPLICEHLPFDFVGYKDEKFIRFQAKYRKDGSVPAKTSWSDKNGAHNKRYGDNDFDYYAIYLPDVKAMCYPSISFMGAKLTTTVPNSSTSFYWYKDFLDLTDKADKKTYRDFGYELTGSKGPRPETRKVVRPSKEELHELIWEKPMTELSKKFGVSDKAIAKWITSYKIEKPPTGYWLRQR